MRTSIFARVDAVKSFSHGADCRGAGGSRANLQASRLRHGSQRLAATHYAVPARNLVEPILIFPWPGSGSLGRARGVKLAQYRVGINPMPMRSKLSTTKAMSI